MLFILLLAHRVHNIWRTLKNDWNLNFDRIPSLRRALLFRKPLWTDLGAALPQAQMGKEICLWNTNCRSKLSAPSTVLLKKRRPQRVCANRGKMTWKRPAIRWAMNSSCHFSIGIIYTHLFASNYLICLNLPNYVCFLHDIYHNCANFNVCLSNCERWNFSDKNCRLTLNVFRCVPRWRHCVWCVVQLQLLNPRGRCHLEDRPGHEMQTLTSAAAVSSWASVKDDPKMCVHELLKRTSVTSS